MKNSLKLAIFVFFCFTGQNSWAQDTENEPKITRKNVLRLDILFPAFTYDRLIWQNEKHKIGFYVGFLVAKGFAPQILNVSRWNKYHAGFGVYYLHGRANHHLEMGMYYNLQHYLGYLGAEIEGKLWYDGNYSLGGGGNVDAYQKLINDPEIKRKIEQKEVFSANNYVSENFYTHQLAFQIGYRYQRTNGGFFFRAGLNAVNVVWYNYSRPTNFQFVGKSKEIRDLLTLPYLGLGWSF